MSENQEKTLCEPVLERMVRFLLKLKPELVLVSRARNHSEVPDCAGAVVEADTKSEKKAGVRMDVFGRVLDI